MTLAKVERKGTYQGVPQWGITGSAEITPSRATAEKWARLENATKGHTKTPVIVEIPTFVETTWELRTWGNAKDGFEVNDTRSAGEVSIRCRVEVNNAGTAQEFLSAYPSDSQIRKALNLGRFKIETEGDDVNISVNRARDGYPLGEMFCTSHDSLSPIRVHRVKCARCQMLSINGIACHETGCPNMGARWDAESGEWIKQRKCFDCGCTVDADDECCNGEEN